MILKNDKETTTVSIGRRIVTAVYIGAREVWTAVTRVWKGSAPWRGDDPW